MSKLQRLSELQQRLATRKPGPAAARAVWSGPSQPKPVPPPPPPPPAPRPPPLPPAASARPKLGTLTLRKPQPVAGEPTAPKLASPEPMQEGKGDARPLSDLERLQALLPPALFGPGVAVPLVENIAVQIRCTTPKEIPDLAIQKLVAAWIRRPAYKEAIARGEPRRNLDGTLPRRAYNHTQMRELEQLLAATYPAVFGPSAEAVPLAIGIHHQIRQAHREHPCMSTKQLGLFMAHWTRRARYLAALARGDVRRNLDGTPADSPSAEQRAQAVSELTRRFGNVGGHPE